MLWALVALLQLPGSPPVVPSVNAPTSLAPRLVQTPKTTPTAITSRAQMAALRGQWVKLEGKAVNAKLAAMVLGDGFSVYVTARPAWGDDAGKRVQVVGRLEQTDAFKASVDAKGQISQGTQGGDWWVRDAVVTVLP